MMNARLDYEYDSAERRLYIDQTAIKRDKNGKAIDDLPKVVQKTDMTNKDNNFFEEFSPELRDEAFIRGLNKKYQQIEFQVGLAYGTISDPNQIDKTATEIRTSKQRSYSTISQMQKNLEDALEHLIYILNIYADLYELAPDDNYEASFEWDDSIIVDAESEQRIAMQEIDRKLMSKKQYLMRRYGLTEEQALEQLAEIQEENKADDIFVEE